MANDVLMSISKDEVERVRLMSEMKNRLDYQSGMAYARKEGLKEGHKEGLKEGHMEIIELLKSGKSPEEIIRDYEVTVSC